MAEQQVQKEADEAELKAKAEAEGLAQKHEDESQAKGTVEAKDSATLEIKKNLRRQIVAIRCFAFKTTETLEEELCHMEEIANSGPESFADPGLVKFFAKNLAVVCCQEDALDYDTANLILQQATDGRCHMPPRASFK